MPEAKANASEVEFELPAIGKGLRVTYRKRVGPLGCPQAAAGDFEPMFTR